MAVSGTYVFTLTRDEMIKAVLRNLGALGAGETPDAEDYVNISQAINVMLKSWVKKGLPLWVTTEVSIPLTTLAKSSWSLGPSGADVTMAKPLRILERGNYLRDSNSHDTELKLYSRQEYDQLGSKSQSQITSGLFYDNSRDIGTVYLLGQTPDITHTLVLQTQRQFMDMVAGTDNFDFPVEWLQAIKWGASAELLTEYPVKESLIPYYEAKAAAMIEECFGFSQEDASVFFVPDAQMMTGRR